jgi:hypothetical protein
VDPRSAPFDRESIEIGKYRICIFVGKIDLWHRPVFGNHALPQFRLQFSPRKPGTDIAHRRGLLEWTLANGLNGVTSAAVLLKDDLASGP